ncbi:hypothetical protein CEXT_552621 [Caerostris extrusa]|uniref:Uncharacterized protein n=1 Tax=Caerostris extrusa TaxID=172846 RepID=A0AAV4UWT3_CAEEX|nr:hypothetical protein CEXT_552621 [Caerostris extrusa]
MSYWPCVPRPFGPSGKLLRPPFLEKEESIKSMTVIPSSNQRGRSAPLVRARSVDLTAHAGCPWNAEGELMQSSSSFRR